MGPENAHRKKSKLEPIALGDAANLSNQLANDTRPLANGSEKVRVQGEGDKDGGDYQREMMGQTAGMTTTTMKT